MDCIEPPKHIAIIMDGNGRWAKERNQPRAFGHKKGLDTVRTVIRACPELKINYLTLYAFSSENWKRPRNEVDFLMRLLDRFLEAELSELDKEGVRFKAIGRMDSLPVSVQKKIRHAEETTSTNQRLKLQVALNYGARQEIVDACKELFAEKMLSDDPTSAMQSIGENDLARHLYTAGIPDPELLIRTSGEMRISNFLLWQISYSELHVSNKFWPDFTRDDLMAALDDFSKRKRRFGDIA
ncbi:MAG: undecaprenyl diphosphate synthase [Candidatus Omnitrophota bacterium]